MQSGETGYKDVDAYIENFPVDVQAKLEALRATIKSAAPGAQEIISYQMPTFYLDGNLVHFAGYKNHIGFYPAPSGIEEFKADVAPYETGKGTLQFPLDEPLPLDLVSRIVAFRVKENAEKAAAKKQKKKKQA